MARMVEIANDKAVVAVNTDYTPAYVIAGFPSLIAAQDWIKTIDAKGIALVVVADLLPVQ